MEDLIGIFSVTNGYKPCLNIINKLKKTKWLKKYDSEYSCVNKATIASPDVDIFERGVRVPVGPLGRLLIRSFKIVVLSIHHKQVIYS